MGSLPKNLIESELFGYEKGAFTGAEKQTAGFFERFLVGHSLWMRLVICLMTFNPDY